MNKDNSLKNNPTMDDDYLFSASCQDCTGLIPSVTHNDAEVDSYEELYPYLPPVAPPLVTPPSVTPAPGGTPEVGDLTKTHVPEIGM